MPPCGWLSDVALLVSVIDGKNCGRCGKCVRTLADLDITGHIKKSRAFQRGYETAPLRRLHPPENPTDCHFNLEELRYCKEHGIQSATCEVLRRALASSSCPGAKDAAAFTEAHPTSQL